LTAVSTLALRPMTAADVEFSFAVFASTREEEASHLPLDEAGKQQFLRSQFELQHTDYQANYPRADYQIVERDGIPIGRLYVDRQLDQILIVDIAVLPEYRGAGIGTVLMSEILNESRQTGKPVRLHVELFNPAMRWYERLGFREIENVSVYALMEWLPNTTAEETL
jgi:ribosomal protein S18 acetylase RimI-like enzyme